VASFSWLPQGGRKGSACHTTTKTTPDPKDAIYTDPDEGKCLSGDGNDTRLGSRLSVGRLPDPPETVEFKKSGKWAWTPRACIDFMPISDVMREAPWSLRKKGKL
jgi:hypothetical protein